MGKEFGKLAKIRRVAYFSLSPHEQNAFAGAITKGVPNMFRRMYAQVFRVVPPFIGSYLIYTWAWDEYRRLNRKNPKDFENDV